MHILFPYMARFKAINWTRYHHLFTKLAEMGHRITVLQPPSAPLTETNFQEIDDVELPENIRLVNVSMPAFFWKRCGPFDKLVKKGTYSLACRREVRRILANDPPDAILVYNLPQAGLLHMTSMAADGRIIRIFDMADDYEAMLETEMGRFALRPVLNIGRRTILHMMDSADLILSVSHTLADDYPDKDIRVLPNGVDLKRFEQARQEGSRRKGKPVVGYLGAFEYFIDFEVILGIAKRLKDIHFRLVGSGRGFEKVKSRVVELGLHNVELPGPVPFHQVPEEIKRMDICLNLFRPIPISHKACPMKLFEYLAMGKPVLTTELEEIKRLGPDFLVTVQDDREAALAIRRLLNTPEEATQRGKAGVDWVRNHFGWEELAKQFVALVEEKARQKPRDGGRLCP